MPPDLQIKTYLWYHTPYIARFNEDGKKSKSKGNHIWHTEAKKLPTSPYADNGMWQRRWAFHEYQRKIAGTPPTMAYIGLKWNWEPKIWDPQTARPNIAVQWNFPNMPDWMKYEGEVLSGTPTQDSKSIDLVVESRVSHKPLMVKKMTSLVSQPVHAGRPRNFPSSDLCVDCCAIGGWRLLLNIPSAVVDWVRPEPSETVCK